LGLHAAFLLFGDAKYEELARKIKNNIYWKFFYTRKHRFALGINEDMKIQKHMEKVNGIFPQGYLPWVFGHSIPFPENSLDWLLSKQKHNGKIKVSGGKYALTPIIQIMGQLRIYSTFNLKAWLWVNKFCYDSATGGIRDKPSKRSVEFCNVAGFGIIALTGFRPFE
jgi:hypothetical protein